MLTPEEREAKRKWLKETYKDHYAYLQRLYGARKKGVADPEQYALERFQEHKELERFRTDPSFHMEYLIKQSRKRYAEDEKKRAQRERSRRQAQLDRVLELRELKLKAEKKA